MISLKRIGPVAQRLEQGLIIKTEIVAQREQVRMLGIALGNWRSGLSSFRWPGNPKAGPTEPDYTQLVMSKSAKWTLCVC